MTRIKICGLTRPDDVAAAISMGADMLGFIHVPASPRFVDRKTLASLLEPVPDTVTTVIVVQNADPSVLDALRAELSFGLFQFHGDEPPGHLQRWQGYKVFHMRGEKPDPQEVARYGQPLLLDTSVGGRRGGTGKTFDWSVIPEYPGQVIVAGGLRPGNVGDLVRQWRPWGVDVSSGVEAEPGCKDLKLLEEFIKNVRRSDDE